MKGNGWKTRGMAEGSEDTKMALNITAIGAITRRKGKAACIGKTTM